MSRLNIFLGDDVFETISGDIIALDYFAINLIDAGYKGFSCIGDFDGEGDFEVLEKNCNVITYPSAKDESDLELALIYALENNYDKVRIYNLNIGNRLDHLINNLRLIVKYQQHYEIEIVDRYNYGYFIGSGKNLIKSRDYQYISFFPLTNNMEITISDDFKYPYQSNVNTLTTLLVSNELLENEGLVTINNGNLFALFSND